MIFFFETQSGKKWRVDADNRMEAERKLGLDPRRVVLRWIYDDEDMPGFAPPESVWDEYRPVED